jgi:hypothetical protein
MMVYVIDRRSTDPPQPSGIGSLQRRSDTFEEGWRRVIRALPGHEDSQVLFVQENEHWGDVVERINAAAGNAWSIYMLRFLAHAAPAYVELGTGISTSNIHHFGRLKQFMTPLNMNGRGIEFHGCNVGRGERGRRFIQRISNIIELPVAASSVRQFGDNRFRFEGDSVVRVKPSRH